MPDPRPKEGNVTAIAHDEWTPSELARMAIDHEYAELLRETLGGDRVTTRLWSGHPGGYLPANDDADDVQATLNWMVAHHELVGRDIDRVRDHLAGLHADMAAAYDDECGAR